MKRRKPHNRLNLLLPLFLLLSALAVGCGGREAPTSSPASLSAPETEHSSPTPEQTTLPGMTESAASSTAPETFPTETAAPSNPEPLPTEPPEEDEAHRLLRELSLEERVAQMFVVTPEALTGVTGPVTAAGESTRAAFDRLPVGGILYMGQNLVSPDQTRAMLAGMDAISRERIGLPAFLCVDEEGGDVARISGNPAFGVEAVPPMAELDTQGNPEVAREAGLSIGAYLRDLGFNTDFAPCADVWTNPENRVVRSRSFGSDPDTVCRMARALAEGLLEQEILPCYKHFPGHGGTAEDSHLGFARLDMDLETLKSSPELAPFLDGAAWEVPMIMTGHIAVPAATGDELPASLSGKLIALLRGPETDYQGLLITDALNMGAVTARYSPGEAAVLAVQAGNDLLLVADHLEEAYSAVLEAVRNGEIDQERIDESVLRILRAKERLP